MILEKTQLIEITDNLSASDNVKKLEFAADIINKGGTVCFPTETVYGLGANALNAAAVKNIFEAKGRPQDNPLIIHLDCIDNAEKYCFAEQNQYLEKIKPLFPGPITAIMKKRDNIPGIVTAGLPNVGVRVPLDPVAHMFLSLCKVPVAAPSANLSGKPSPTCAQHVINDLNGKVDAIICSGNSSVGLESTIINLVSEPPMLLRPGGITYEKLCSLLGKVSISDAVLSEMKPDDVASAPGMKYKHYAPKSPVFLVIGNLEEFKNFLIEKNFFEKFAVLAFAEDIQNLNLNNIFNIGSYTNPEEVARNIFSCLRATDEICGIEKVYVHITDDKTGLNLAIFNRLLKASSYHIIDLRG